MIPSSVLLLLMICSFFLGGLRDLLPWTLFSLLVWGVAVGQLGKLESMEFPSAWGFWLLWLGASLFFSLEPFRSLLPFWKKATYILFFFMLSMNFSPRDRAYWFYGLCFLGVVLGLAVLSGRDLLRPNDHYTPAVEAALFGACLWALAGDGHSRKTAAGLVLLMLFSLFIILRARSRGALLAVCAATGVLLVRNVKRGGLIFLVLCALAMGAFALLPQDAQDYFLKSDDPGRYLRLWIWKAAIQIGLDYPWFGTGLGNFERGFLYHNFPNSIHVVSHYNRYAEHADSEILQLAAEAGWAGLILFLWALRDSMAWGRKEQGSWRREAARGACVSLLSHSLVQGIFSLPSLSLLLFSSLAFGAGPGAARGWRLSGRSWKAICALGCLICCLAWAPEGFLRTWQAAASSHPPGEKNIDFLKKSLRITPEDSWLRNRLARAYLLSPMSHVGLALSEQDEAIRRNPTNAVYLIQKANVLERFGARREVCDLSKKALDLEPKFVEAHLLMAECHLLNGRKNLARDNLETVKHVLEEVKVKNKGEPLPYSYDRLLTSLDEKRYSRLLKGSD